MWKLLCRMIKVKEKAWEKISKSKYNGAGGFCLPHFYSCYLATIKNKTNQVFLNFRNISKNTVKKLESLGIKDTKKLFEFVKTEKSRKELSSKTGISSKEILELTKLTDVCRITRVGATFARILVDSSCDTVKKIAKADYEKLYEEINKINEEKKYYKVKFGFKDMKRDLLAAKSVPNAIKY